MFEHLDTITNKYDEIHIKLASPDAFSDQQQFVRLTKELSDMEPLVNKIRERGDIVRDLGEANQMLAEKPDKDFREFLQDEIESLKSSLTDIEGELKILLLPKDPKDEKSVIIEIRAGAGGDEAALFAGVLYRMYSMYAEGRGWKQELVDASPTEIGGFKEVVFAIDATGAYSRFKFESGVHRVQRVPATESSGRIHTSTVTVAVLAQIDEVDVEINPNDLEIDTFRASGAGGQHINKTDSAIRVTHKPSGIVVTCQDQRSQHKNRDRALTVLRSKLYDIAVANQESDVAQARKEQVGTGNRNERIRTYNYPQGRVTDHRINLTLYRIEGILNGDIDEIFDSLVTRDQALKLSSYENDVGLGTGHGTGQAGKSTARSTQAARNTPAAAPEAGKKTG